MITPVHQMAIAVEDEVEEAGGAADLLKYLLNPVKKLSGELRCLDHPFCSADSLGV